MQVEWMGAIKQSLDGKLNHSLTSAQPSVHNIWWKIQLEMTRRARTLGTFSERKNQPGNWIMGQNTPQAMGIDARALRVQLNLPPDIMN